MRRLPRVGVAVILIRDDKVLVGHRYKTLLGPNTWGFPGGHLEFNETIKDCAIREVTEETGMKIDDITIGPTTNDMYEKEDRHYITIFTIAKNAKGEPKVMEPKKCREWQWFYWNNLPTPFFLPFQNLLKQNYSPFT